MLFKIITILTIVTIAKCHDVVVGLDLSGRKIFDEKRVASPAIWRQTENVTINATEGEVISRVVITDLRPEKDGDVRILEGGEGQKSVTIELKSPTVLRGFEFQIEAYAAPQKNQGTTDKGKVEHPSQVRNQRNIEQPSNQGFGLTTIAESSSKAPEGTGAIVTKEDENKTQVSTTEAINDDTPRLISVLNNDDSRDLSQSTTEQARTSRGSESRDAGNATVNAPKTLGNGKDTGISTSSKDLDINKDQSRYSRDTQDAINSGKPSLVPTVSAISTKINEQSSELTPPKDDYENHTNIPLYYGLKSGSINVQTNNDTSQTVRDTQNESKTINNNAPAALVKSTTAIPTYIKDTTEQNSKNIQIDNSRAVRDTKMQEKTQEHINVPKSLTDIISDQKFDDPAKSIYDSESTIEPDESSTLFRGLISSDDKSESKGFALSTEYPDESDEKTRISRGTENESKRQEDINIPKLLIGNNESKMASDHETTINPEESYSATLKSLSTEKSSTEIPRNVRQIQKDSKETLLPISNKSNQRKQETKLNTQDSSPFTPVSPTTMDISRIFTSTITSETKDANDATTINKDLHAMPKSIVSDPVISIQ